MLEELRISGLGVIDSHIVQLEPGLTVLTGETGAGKTMVVSSLRLLTGARADVERLRDGADKAVIEGRFSLNEVGSASESELTEMIADTGAEVDDAELIAIRTLSAHGKSRAHLGGRSVPVGALARVIPLLLTIHGQNDQLKLQKPDAQRDLVDYWAGEECASILEQYRVARTQWKTAHDELQRRITDARSNALEADRLSASIAEIDEVQPTPGEDSELQQRIRLLMDSEALREAAAEAVQVLHGDELGQAPHNVQNLLGQARGALEKSSDPVLVELSQRIDEAESAMSDIASELTGYLSNMVNDSTAVDELLARQAAVKNLLRKYGSTADEVLAWADQARVTLSALDTSDEAMAALQQDVLEAAEKTRNLAFQLSARRKKAAEDLAQRITAELESLAMGSSRVDIAVRSEFDQPSTPNATARARATGNELLDFVSAHCGPDGADTVEFLLAAHADAPARGLAKTASGGELSRLMLAIEVVIAQNSRGGTMVFDEVDAGVGGASATQIGRKLAQLARRHQVIVVTHLPQVAAYADQHLLLAKTSDHADTVSTVSHLDHESRVKELARMLAGRQEAISAQIHAAELIEDAAVEKEKWTLVS